MLMNIMLKLGILLKLKEKVNHFYNLKSLNSDFICSVHMCKFRQNMRNVIIEKWVGNSFEKENLSFIQQHDIFQDFFFNNSGKLSLQIGFFLIWKINVKYFLSLREDYFVSVIDSFSIISKENHLYKYRRSSIISYVSLLSSCRIIFFRHDNWN